MTIKYVEPPIVHFDSLIYNNVTNYLNKKLLSESMDSTEKGIYSLLEQILKEFNNKLYPLGISCDLSKAFDWVDHNIGPTARKNYSFEV